MWERIKEVKQTEIDTLPRKRCEDSEIEINSNIEDAAIEKQNDIKILRYKARLT